MTKQLSTQALAKSLSPLFTTAPKLVSVHNEFFDPDTRADNVQSDEAFLRTSILTNGVI